MFTPKSPATRATCEEVDAAEASLPVAELIDLAVAGASVEDFKFPVVQFPVRLESDLRSRGFMVFASVDSLVGAVGAVARIDGDAIHVTGTADGALVDSLAHTSAFGSTPEIKGTARWVIRALAAARGVVPSSIHDLYLAMGQAKAGGFTVPAMNVRDDGLRHGACRIPRRQRPQRRCVHLRDRPIGNRLHRAASARVRCRDPGRGAARGLRGSDLHPGRPLQVNAKKYATPERDKELETLRKLIREEIAAGFCNIDIDTSTLVDLDKPTLDEQQVVNCDAARRLHGVHSRPSSPLGVTISVGGEIGEVGGKNSDVHELHAFMDGLLKALKARGPGSRASARSACRPGPRTEGSSRPTARCAPTSSWT